MKSITVGFFIMFLILFSTFVVSSLSKDLMSDGGRIHLHKPVEMPTDTALLKDNTLVFFGYVGCEDICTPRMSEIVAIYKEYKAKSTSDDLSVFFISLKEEDSAELADRFAKSFHSEFVGFSLPKNTLLKFTNELNVYYSKSLFKKGDINHTESLYLISMEKDGTPYLNNIYMQTPYNKEMIVKDLTEDILLKK